MLITLCYALLTLVQQRQRTRLLRVLREHVQQGSIVFHRHESQGSTSGPGSAFTSHFCENEARIEGVKLLFEKGKKKVTNVIPKQKVNLLQWTSFLDLADSGAEYKQEDRINILVEASYFECSGQRQQQRNSVEPLSAVCVHVEEYCVPKAWRFRDAFGLIAESSVEDFALLGAAFLDDQLCMNEGMEIKKLMTVNIEGSPSSLLDPSSFSLSLSPCWSSHYLGNAENGGMTLADFSPESEALLLEAGISPDDVVGTALSSPDFPPLEEMDQELYGGSNESLAEKVPSLLNESLESLSDSDSSAYEVDGASIESAASNEAEAGSQASSPLKTGGDSIYESFQSTEATLEENSEYYGGEAMADTSCSIVDADSQIMTSSSSRGSPVDNPSSLLISGELSSPAAILSSPMFSSGSIGEGRTMKPPNILIYTGEDSASGSCVRFKNIRDNLLLCLNPDCYAIYPLTPDQVDKVPWSENTALLIISCDNVEEDIAMHFYTFLSSGGKMVSFCSNLDFSSFSVTKLKSVDKKQLVSVKYKEWEDVQLLQGLSMYKRTADTCDITVLGYNSEDQTPVILDARSREGEGEGHVIVSQVHLEMDPVVMCSEEAQFARLKQFNHGRISIFRDLLTSRLEINCDPRPKPTLTECYLATRNKETMTQFWTAIKPKLHNNKLKHKNMTLYFICADYQYDIPKVSSTMIPVIYSSAGSLSNLPFDAATYFSNLKTTELGRVVFFAEVFPTTMAILQGFTDYTGAVAIARRQTEGKGRGSNQWLSPEGCAMFTANFSFPLKSKLGQHLPFVQHLTSLAMLLAIRKAPGCENINLTVKWPNDIYYGKEIKVGGSIVNSTVSGSTVYCSVGCGLNVSNSSPTTCVNDLIFLYNQQYASCLPTFSIEEVIAMILTQLDSLVTQFQIHGSADILSEYYSYWLHSNQQVTLEGSGEVVTVQGLNDQGYLQVKTNAGVALSLQPDGNSFDMMRNLIAIKNQ